MLQDIHIIKMNQSKSWSYLGCSSFYSYKSVIDTTEENCLQRMQAQFCVSRF